VTLVDRFITWMADTPWSIALKESLYVWPLAESLHVLCLALFVGTTTMLDLRLLGLAFRRVPTSDFTGRILPWTRAGFGVMAVTGLMLFYANPVRYYHNVFFRIKVVMLLVAGINVWLFHSRTHRRVTSWDRDSTPPRAARVAAVISLLAWATVVIVGRMIAYNWFDCDIQPQSRFINWVSSCGAVVPLG
jgi:hypothetical protein